MKPGSWFAISVVAALAPFIGAGCQLDRSGLSAVGLSGSGGAPVLTGTGGAATASGGSGGSGGTAATGAGGAAGAGTGSGGDAAGGVSGNRR